MRCKKVVLFLPVTIFLIFALFTSSSAQIANHKGEKHVSFYFGGGYNKSWFGPSTIHVEQSSLKNSYDLLKVKGDNAHVKPIFPWQLNYRLGCYFNYEQTCGVEFSYNPVNYHVSDQSIQLKGTVSGAPNTNLTIPFSLKNGYLYEMDGANLLLLNFVRRFQLYKPNFDYVLVGGKRRNVWLDILNNLRVDVIGKVGGGAAMPHFATKFVTDSFDALQFQLCGWDAGAEAALRLVIYRYGYIEFAGRYDYAMYNKLQLYKGTATQNIGMPGFVITIGGSLPTNRFNPLFFHERNVINMTPFFQNKVNQDSLDKEAAKEKKHKKHRKHKKGDDGFDVPEFESIKDKKAKFSEQVMKIRQDSLAHQAMLDSIAHQQIMDSIANQQMNDSIARKIYNDSVEADRARRDTVSISSMDTTLKPTVPDHKETKKERKARLKKEKLAEKEKAAEQPAAPVTDSTGAVPAVPVEKLSKKQLKAKKKQEAQERKEKEAKEKENNAGVPVTPPDPAAGVGVPPPAPPAAPDAAPSKMSRKERKAKEKHEAELKKQEEASKPEVPAAPPVVTPPADAPPAPPAESPAPGLSKKELKAKKKQEAKELKEKQKQEQEAKDKAEKELNEMQKQEQDAKEKADKELKEKAQADAEQAKKANKENEKKNAAELKEKQRQEQEAKDKAENEQKEAERAKKEQEKKDKKEKKEQEKKEKEEKKAREKKEKQEEKDKEQAEKDARKEQERKEKEAPKEGQDGK